MEITNRMLLKLATRQAAMNRLKERQDALKEEIRQALDKGIEPPTDGPYILGIMQVGGKDFSWEDECEELLTKAYSKKYPPKVAAAAAKERMKEMKEQAPDKKSVNILGKDYVGGIKMQCKPNPDYVEEKSRKVA